MTIQASSRYYKFDTLISANGLAQSWVATNLTSSAKCFLKVSISDGSLDAGTAKATLVKSYSLQTNLHNRKIHRALRKTVEDGQVLVEYPFLDPDQWHPLTAGHLWSALPMLLSQICLTTDFMHLMGVVHCDLKLENFLVNMSHGKLRILLTDLDFLRENLSPLKAQIIGTPDLIAPEVMLNEAVTFQSDNYSLGMSLKKCVDVAGSVMPSAADPDQSQIEKLIAFCELLTMQDPGARPLILLDALSQSGLVDQKAFDSLNKRLLIKQLFAILRNENGDAKSNLSHLQRLFMEKAKIFGLPEEFIHDLQLGLQQNSARAMHRAAAFLHQARLQRYEDCWSISASDPHWQATFRAIDNILGQDVFPSIDLNFDSEGLISQQITKAVKHREEKHYLRAFLTLKQLHADLPGTLKDSHQDQALQLLRELATISIILNRNSEAVQCLSDLMAHLEEGSVEYLKVMRELTIRYLILGQTEQALLTADRGAEASAKIGDEAGRHDFLRQRAWVLSASGKHEEAITLLEQTAQYAEEADQPNLLMDACYYLGSVYWRSGKFDRSEHYYEKSIALAKDRGLQAQIIPALTSLSLLCFERSRYAQSVSLSKLAMRQITNPSDLYGVPYLCSSLTLCYTRLGEYQKAIYWNQRYLSTQLGNIGPGVFGYFFLNDGWIKSIKGDYSRAFESLQKALSILRPLGKTRNLGKVYQNLAELAIYQGDAESCEKYIAQAIDVFTHLGDQASLADIKSFGGLNDFYHHQSDLINLLPLMVNQLKANSLYLASLTLFHILVNDETEISDQALAEAEAYLFSIDKAETPLHKALSHLISFHHSKEIEPRQDPGSLKLAFRILSEAGHFFQVLLICRKIAECYRRLGDEKLTKKFLLQALRLAERIKNRQLIPVLKSHIEQLTRADHGQVREANLLHDFAAILKDLGDYDETLNRIVKFAVEKTGAERGVLLLKSDRTSELQVKSFLNCDDVSLMEIKDFSRNVPLRVLADTHPILIDNAREDSRTKDLKSIVVYNILSVVCLPILRENEVIGVLYLDHHTIPALFEKDDVLLITSLANLISLVLGTAKEYRKMKLSQEQLLKDLSDLGSRRTFITQNQTMLALLAELPEIAHTNVGVLLIGESGTGKEILACMLHDLSLRKDGPLVKLNCAAIPATMIEPELFGVAKNTATGVGEREGKFQAADGGTLFLDEIADMPLEVQAKVLRVLEYQEFQRVGSNRTILTDIRFVYATNRKPQDLVKQGRLREDLYYRINTISIEIPPLRERPDDIPVLIDHFLRTFSHDRRPPQLSAQIIEDLTLYDWPGNVRELRNTMERLCIVYAGKQVILDNLPESIQTAAKNADKHSQSFQNREAKMISKLLLENGWNQSKVAAIMGIPLSTLRHKIKKYKLKRPR